MLGNGRVHVARLVLRPRADTDKSDAALSRLEALRIGRLRAVFPRELISFERARQAFAEIFDVTRQSGITYFAFGRLHS